jgi:hypothetical protein
LIKAQRKIKKTIPVLSLILKKKYINRDGQSYQSSKKGS